jgi:hypothetical protein
MSSKAVRLHKEIQFTPKRKKLSSKGEKKQSHEAESRKNDSKKEGETFYRGENGMPTKQQLLSPSN